MIAVHHSSASKRSAWLATVLAGLALSCSLSVDAGREQCRTDGDCQRRGGVFSASVCVDSVCSVPERWACLPEGIASTSMGRGPFTVHVPLVSVLTQKPVADVTAQVCAKIDSACIAPLGEAVKSDELGILTLNIEADFDGFLKLEHPDFGTSLYFFNPSVTRDVDFPAVRLASTEMVAMLMQQIGTTYDPSRGAVVLTASDCLGDSASGVGYSENKSDDRIKAFYSADGLPTTLSHATDASGYGGFIDVPPGNLSIQGTQEDFGAVGSLSLFVKAGTTSYSRMVPNAKR